MKRKLVLFAGFLILLTLAADVFASATCKTRSRCRWWSKQYVATSVVGCAWPQTLLCYRRGSSCGPVSNECTWRSCLWGGARANAANGPGGCFLGGARSGLGTYGEPSPDHLDPNSQNGEGDHELVGRVEFVEQESAQVHLESLRMNATLDESFSRLDVTAYIESEEALANDDDAAAPERIVWKGFIHLQNGVVTQAGFEEEVEEYLGHEGITEVLLAGIVKEIPFDGTTEEFDRLAVDLMVDGGLSEAEEAP